MTTHTPHESVEALQANPALSDGDDERFSGYGVMGLPFASGHYLALRDMVSSSVGPAYRAVWHRDPSGPWTIYTTADPEVSCPRYFGSLTDAEKVPTIEVTWGSDSDLDVTIAAAELTWRIELGSSPATRAMTAMGGRMPAAAWNSNAVLASMGPMARTFLRPGRVRLQGATPNGPRFKAAPVQVWRVVGGGAALRGENLGELGPLATQANLGDFWLPQRGIFFVGRARFSPEAASTSSAASVRSAAS